jgi:hypothetical protein
MPAVTADRSQYAEPRPPAWYVHTDQGVLLAGPYPDEQTARAHGNRLPTQIRAGMRREGHTEPAIAERAQALRVSLGTTEPPHGEFRVRRPHAPAHPDPGHPGHPGRCRYPCRDTTWRTVNYVC